MKKFKLGKLWALICSVMACVMIFSLAACTDKGEEGELTLSATTAQVEVGKTVNIQVNSDTTKDIEWSSDKTDIATVKGAGQGNKVCTITGVAAGTATVTAKAGNLTATCAVTVKAAGQVDDGGDDDTPTPVDVTFAAEGDFATGWHYWAGSGDATVTSCKTYTDTNETTIKYDMKEGCLFYSVQLFYKDFKTTGVEHDVTLTVVSDVAANITVNGAKQELIVGEKEVDVKGYAGSTLSVQFGVADENTVLGVHEFTFKNLVVTSKADVELAAPSFTITDGEEGAKVINITDNDNNSENVQRYELGVFNNATDEMPAYDPVVVTNGGVLEMPKVPTGNYVIKLRAYNESSKVLSSPWSKNPVNLAWVNPGTPLEYKENDKIAAGSNTWYYWNQTWDAVCEFKSCSIENDPVQGDIIKVVGLKNNVGKTWSFQLFYKGTAGKKFNITVTAQNAGNIIVGGTVKTLEAGKAETWENVDATTLGIQFGSASDENDTTNNLQGDITLVIKEVTA